MWRNKKSMITSITHFQKILDVLWPENSLTSFYEYSYYWFIIIITSLWWTFFKTQTFDSTGTIWTTGIIRKAGITRTTGMTRMTGTTKTTGLTKTNQDNWDNWDNWKDRDDWDHWNNWDNLDNQDNQDTHNWDIWDNWEDYYSKCINNSGGGSSKVRGGEWYLKKRGSRKILTGSQNLGSVFDNSRSLVFAWFVFFRAQVSGSDI